MFRGLESSLGVRTKDRFSNFANLRALSQNFISSFFLNKKINRHIELLNYGENVVLLPQEYK